MRHGRQACEARLSERGNSLYSRGMAHFERKVDWCFRLVFPAMYAFLVTWRVIMISGNAEKLQVLCWWAEKRSWPSVDQLDRYYVEHFPVLWENFKLNQTYTQSVRTRGIWKLLSRYDWQTFGNLIFPSRPNYSPSYDIIQWSISYLSFGPDPESTN